MLVNTFAELVWTFWVGLGFAVVAGTVYVLLVLENRKEISKKLNKTAAPEETQTKEKAKIEA